MKVEILARDGWWVVRSKGLKELFGKDLVPLPYSTRIPLDAVIAELRVNPTWAEIISREENNEQFNS